MTLQKLRSFSHVFFTLLQKDLSTYFRLRYIGDLIDNWTWTTIFMFIMTYVLPHVGLSSSYGPFFAVGMIASVAFWDSWSTTTSFIADLEDTRTIEYYLTLPIPATLYFLKQICYFAIRAGALSLTIIPLARVLLWNHFNLSQVNILQSLIMFVLMLFFCSAISLIMASMVKDIKNMGHVAIRTLMPMFSTGGTQYSWLTAYSISPWFAYATLANPLIYATEGLHAAMLGQEGYLPFWICTLALTAFTLIIGAWAIARMKRRLDCV